MRFPLPLLATLGSLTVALGLAVVPLVSVDLSTAQAQDENMMDDGMMMDAGPVNEIPVEMDEFYFDPADLVTLAGQTTRFQLTNVGQFSHRLAYDWNGERVRSESVRNGQPAIWDVVFDTPGMYEIYCDVTYEAPLLHRDVGMVGMITVLAPDM